MAVVAMERTHPRKRRLSTPPAPQLLSPLDNNLTRSSSSSLQLSSTRQFRVKDRREATKALDHKQRLEDAHERQSIQCSDRFHARWRSLRALYASTCEFISNKNADLVAKGTKSKITLTPVNPPLQATPAKSTIWVRDLALECRRSFVEPLVTLPQLETAFRKALRLHSSLKASAGADRQLGELLTNLWAVFRAFSGRCESVSNEKADFRDVLNALYVFDRWRDGERRLLMLWFDEFCHFSDRYTSVIEHHDISRVLMSTAEGEEEESAIRPVVDELVTNSSGRFVTLTQFEKFIDSHSTLLKLIKFQCWKRLTDDTRLAFYRELYVEARESFRKEEARVQLERALLLWRLREPRARWRRWVDFVADRKLLKRGDRHFYECSGVKMVTFMRDNVRRRVQMREMVDRARVQREKSLKRWVFSPWHIFYESTMLLHTAAVRRGDRFHRNTILKRSFRVLTAFYEDAKARHAVQRARVKAFIAKRELKVVNEHFRVWESFYRRRVEVAAADKRQQQLLGTLSTLAKQQDELAKMAMEDAISAAVEVKTRQMIEEERRRSFQKQSDQVMLMRRLRQQEEARSQFKRERDQKEFDAAALAWNHIADQVEIEVRKSTLAWLNDTVEGETEVHNEATRIFETDPKILQQHFLRSEDPSEFALIPSRCRWQLRLEDGYGGDLRLSKPYFLNLQTFEKFVCDELVMDDCAIIAREVIVARRIDAALDRVRQKQSAQQVEALQIASATKIQAMARIRRARKAARAIIRARFVRRIEPRTGDLVFFDIYSQRSKRKPPMLAASDVTGCIPAESTSWVRRIDDEGRDYYITITDGIPESEQQWSWSPPDHFAMCERCHANLASRRRTSTGERACVVCYAELRHRLRKQLRSVNGSFNRSDANANGIVDASGGVNAASSSSNGAVRAPDEGEDDWTKVAVQALGCVVCRNAPAVAICHAARRDAACHRCHQAVHAKLKCVSSSSCEQLTSRTGPSVL